MLKIVQPEYGNYIIPIEIFLSHLKLILRKGNILAFKEILLDLILI